MMQYDGDTFTARMPNGERVTLRVKRDIEKLDDLDPGERMAATLKMFPNDTQKLDNMERSRATGAYYPRAPRSFLEILDEDDDEESANGDDDDTLEKIFTGKADDRGEDEGNSDRRDDGGNASDHVLSRLADLLVESGRFTDRGHALRHLTSHPDGVALVRTHKGKDDPPMQDTVHSIMKSGGISATCAAIVSKGRTSISQDDLVSAVGKVARQRWPELSEAQAFAKVYSDPTEGRVLRQAINVAKDSLAQQMLGPGLPVQVVGGPDAMLDAVGNDQSEIEQARAELMRDGRKQYPRLSENEVFERALTDPRNAAIVERLYQRPTPTSIYPMPRQWLAGDGSQHAKADHDSGAYGKLLAKAKELQASHTELSEAQAFEKIYTDRANIELAKRERRENAVR
jgi:hypothetical protein